MSDSTDSNKQADSSRDDYNERVLRNEGELAGLKLLVSETREADRKLIEQRSESLARELERRADYLALPAPTLVQVGGQVAVLTRQMQAVIRLLASVD